MITMSTLVKMKVKPENPSELEEICEENREEPINAEFVSETIKKDYLVYPLKFKLAQCQYQCSHYVGFGGSHYCIVKKDADKKNM